MNILTNDESCIAISCEETKESIKAKVNKVFNPIKADDANVNKEHIAKIVRYNVSLTNVLNELSFFYKWTY